MSPRAACRLEGLGFDKVYDYTAGIADWKAAGLPTDGSEPPVLTVADASRPDIPVAAADERLAAVLERALLAEWDEALVVDCDGIVVGCLRGTAWESDAQARVEEVMESGPTTVRPNGILQPLLDRMTKRGTKLVVVTTPQGHLVGQLAWEDAARIASGESPEQVWRDCDGCPGRWAAR